MKQEWKKESITDVITLVSGAWLFLSPWIFGFAPEAAASWNAWLSGAIIFALAVVALAAFAEWEEWLSLAAGIWVIVSPWIIGFSANATAMYSHVIVGVVVMAAAAVRLWLFYHGPPRVTA